MHVIQLCGADANRRLTLNYEDGERHIWNGDVNYAALTWRSTSVTIVQQGPVKYTVIELLGGEKICFGQGILPHGGMVQLPDGFTVAQMFAMAFPHDTDVAAAGDNQVEGFASWIEDSVVSFTYEDGEHHQWHGNASVLIFAWQNNSGAVTAVPVTGGSGIEIALPNGQVLGVAKARLSDGATFDMEVPNSAVLQAICTPETYTIPDGHVAHGVKACYLDGNNKVLCQFEDGEGHTWTGEAGVFALWYGGGAAATAIVVAIAPTSASVQAGATQQFTASVLGSTNHDVTWSVDGIPGGNATVGTIVNGLYTAPPLAGQHTITALSAADPSATDDVVVTVYGGQPMWIIG